MGPGWGPTRPPSRCNQTTSPQRSSKPRKCNFRWFRPLQYPTEPPQRFRCPKPFAATETQPPAAGPHTAKPVRLGPGGCCWSRTRFGPEGCAALDNRTEPEEGQMRTGTAIRTPTGGRSSRKFSCGPNPKFGPKPVSGPASDVGLQSCCRNGLRVESLPHQFGGLSKRGGPNH